MLFNAAMISLLTFTPGFLQDAGFSITSAGFLTSLTMWPSLVLGPGIGYVMDKIDHKRTIIAIGGVTLAILIALIPSAGGWMLALMLLIGVSTSLIPAPIFALPSELVTSERLGFAFGVLATFSNLGIVMGPVTIGFIRDITGSYQASYALMSGLALLLSIIMIVLGLRHNQKTPTMN